MNTRVKEIVIFLASSLSLVICSNIFYSNQRQPAYLSIALPYYPDTESQPRFSRSHLVETHSPGAQFFHSPYQDEPHETQPIGRSLQVRSRKAKLPSSWTGEETETKKDTASVAVGDEESGRHFSPESIQKFTETLGAINTVGRFLVNMTRAQSLNSALQKQKEEPAGEDVPAAIYTISKNVLGPNVTDTIAPIVRQFPLVGINNGKVLADGGRSCTTPNRKPGVCDDLSSCPELLLDLANLRQSICFKSLFVPGVCCPLKGEGAKPTISSSIYQTTRRPYHTTTTITTTVSSTSTRRPTTHRTTSERPFLTSSLPPLTIDSEDCGQQEVPGFRVVGGIESTPGQWPWMAAIFLHGLRRTEFWCGGSLIGKRHILTAAHCTRDTRQKPFSPRQFTVRLGDVDLRSTDEPSQPETYNVVEIRAHPKFSRVGFYNDIAILILDRDVRKSKYVIPLCLPEEYRNEKFVGNRPTVVGWGTTYYGGKESTTQRQADLPVWRNDDCDRAYFQPIDENFICAGYADGGKDACQGDSGGPLMLQRNNRWLQIGIVSFGNKCGEPGYPGVYTRVTQYLGWIKQNMYLNN